MSPTPEQEERKERLDAKGEEQPVWTYRGYEIRPSEFNTAMVHFYRGELHRANVWRQRLDSTTNWAVVATAGVLSLAFGSGAAGQAVIIVGSLLVTLFLYIEARRYRYYELWSARVRLLETDFYAAMLVPPFRPAPDWAETLAENLLHPRFPISMWEAVGRRLRRNYLWIYFILVVAWIFSVILASDGVSSVQEAIDRASLGGIPGEIMLLGALLFYGAVVVVSLVTRSLTEASGEVLPRYNASRPSTRDALLGMVGVNSDQGWFRPRSRRREQIMAQIITDEPQAVAERILREMSRGVTRIDGTGMYTGRERPMLLCAITITETARLKALVAELDPEAMIIIIPAHAIYGKGFQSLS